MDANPSETELIFQTDAYCAQVETRIAAVEEAGKDSALALERTIFFPGGGGQPCDRGGLAWEDGEHPVVGLQKSGNQILHAVRTPRASLPAPGTPVVARLDWEHRHQLMRTHTALHILCGVIWRDWRCQVTGSNMKPLEGRMDFEFEGMPADLAAEIVRRANVEVDADREVKVAILPRDEALAIPDLIRTKVDLLPPAITAIRTVEIVGLDLQADGGTHVRRTSEVGRIRLLKHESMGRINKRLRVAIEDR